MPATPLVETPFQWWLPRLPLYNVGLAVSGMAAFILYVIVGVANVCYMIGPISESVLRPDDVRVFRLRWFDFGCPFSFSLPF